MEDEKAAKKLAAKMKMRQMQNDWLAREEALDRETSKKVDKKWFGKLLQSKLPEMKENLRNILDYMEKLVEVEVFRMRLFEEERIELSDQLNFQAQGHSQAMDKLYDLYLQRVQDLQDIYTQQINKKRDEAEEALVEIIKMGEKNKEDIHAIQFQMGVNQETNEDSMECRMFFETDDEKSKIAEKSESLRTGLERLMEKRWYQISNILADHQLRTEQRRNHYIALQTRDKQESKIIQSQMRKTQKLNEQIQQLKDILENKDFNNPKMILIADRREESAKFYNSFVYFKKVLSEEMKLDDVKLKQLTALSKETNDYLDQSVKKGEKILTLFTLCLKLETEKEKVVPVGRNLYKTKVVKHKFLPMPHDRMIGMDRGAIKSSMLEEFHYFWLKVGKVRLSRAALSHCLSELQMENEALKKLLRSYFGNMSNKILI